MWHGAEDIRGTLKSFGFFFFRGRREVDICFGIEGVRMAGLALLEGHVNLPADCCIGLQRHWGQQRVFPPTGLLWNISLHCANICHCDWFNQQAD